MNQSLSKSLSQANYLFCCLVLALGLVGCEQPSQLEQIKERKTLHVISRNAPGIYYEGRDTSEGFEYEFASLFAKNLGLDLDVKVAGTRAQIRSALDNNYTNMAASMMVLSEANTSKYKHSEPFLETTPLIVYRYGSKRPRSIADLSGKTIAVVSDSDLVTELESLILNHPDLKWETVNSDTEELIRMVQDKEVDFALVYSLELKLHRAFYPRVRQAFEFGSSRGIAWFFPNNSDNTLINAANAFIQQSNEDGTLMQLEERYYGHLAQVNYVGARTFIRHTKQRLPKYEDTYKKYATEYETDWRLMAAMGYQESHWRPNAVSPTGVRGLMMLTLVTAKEMGIKNRLDPIQSIKGGSKYFSKIHKRISEDVQEPDRTWFALASYNVGLGHLEDARMLTEKGGKDPNKWADVKDFLPLLQQKKYYSQTKYGYARGKEPVIYVQNIRRYYDVLRWLDESRRRERPKSTINFDENLVR